MIAIANGALVARPLVSSEFLGLNAVSAQAIRWRKPMWLGTAKSKIFRIPERPVIPAEDRVELIRLFNNYRTYYESIRRHLMEVTAADRVQYDEASVRQQEEEDFARCSMINDEWNKKVKESREAREREQLEARRAQTREKIAARKEREAAIFKEVEETVRAAKAEAHTFITAENIDEAIEKALSTVVSYNVAIDLDGKRYEGKYVPEEKESTKFVRRSQVGQ